MFGWSFVYLWGFLYDFQIKVYKLAFAFILEVKMKHSLKITTILLLMFIVTQFIGLYVVNYYSPVRIIDGEAVDVVAPELPFGMQSPEVENESDYFYRILPSLIFAFIIAISILVLLTKFDASFILRLWFFGVVIVALALSFVAIVPYFRGVTWLALVAALPFAYVKIFKRNFVVHNLTELFIYPGIAAVFVSILNLWVIIIILIIISIYDMWAVWSSGIMQKMARYQIDKVGVLAGFFIPHADKKTRAKIKNMSKSDLKKSKIKVNVAILGGGDVVFAIIAAGVVMKTWGLLPAIFVIIGATLGLSYLFFFAKKKKFYPAMPFISAGIFLGMIAGSLIS